MVHSNLITLPQGHNWQETDLGAACVAFECDCGATFTQDLQDGSVEYEPGDGHDED